MYSEHSQPVFIAPVYGTILHNVPDQNFNVLPHVPEVTVLRHIAGLGDIEQVPFTVVPIFALDATKFGYLSTVRKSPPLPEDTFQLKISNQIRNHRKDANANGKEFRALSKLVVLSADGGLINAPPSAFTVGHCAAGA